MSKLILSSIRCLQISTRTRKRDEMRYAHRVVRYWGTCLGLLFTEVLCLFGPCFFLFRRYSQMLLIILSCFRQLAHPFLNPATPMQLGLIVVLGVFLGASVLIERHLADFDVKFAVISFVVGAVLLAWAPVVVWLDRCLIQLRHRKHDSRPQYEVPLCGCLACEDTHGRSLKWQAQLIFLVFFYLCTC